MTHTRNKLRDRCAAPEILSSGRKLKVPDQIPASGVSTLCSYGKSGASFGDIVLFYLIPFGASLAIVFILERILTAGAANALATVFSIFIGLLLNLLVLIFDLVRSSEGSPKMEIRKKVLQETFANISYAIFVSVVLVVLLFGSRLVTNATLLKVFSVLSFAMVGNFLLTLLMVLKRVHTLLSGETKP